RRGRCLRQPALAARLRLRRRDRHPPDPALPRRAGPRLGPGPDRRVRQDRLLHRDADQGLRLRPRPLRRSRGSGRHRRARGRPRAGTAASPDQGPAPLLRRAALHSAVLSGGARLPASLHDRVRLQECSIAVAADRGRALHARFPGAGCRAEACAVRLLRRLRRRDERSCTVLRRAPAEGRARAAPGAPGVDGGLDRAHAGDRGQGAPSQEARQPRVEGRRLHRRRRSDGWQRRPDVARRRWHRGPGLHRHEGAGGGAVHARPALCAGAQGRAWRVDRRRDAAEGCLVLRGRKCCKWATSEPAARRSRHADGRRVGRGHGLALRAHDQGRHGWRRGARAGDACGHRLPRRQVVAGGVEARQGREAQRLVARRLGCPCCHRGRPADDGRCQDSGGGTLSTMSDLTEATRKAYQLRDPQEAMEIVHRTGPVSGFGLHADLTDTVRAQAELHRIFGTGGALQKGVSDIRALWLSSLASSYSLLNDAQAGAIVSAWKQAFGEDLDALPPDQVYKGNGRNVGDSASLLGVLMEVVTKASDSSKPYGNVTYADPGWQKDGKARYPLDSEQHIRAAWSYINQAKNAALYTAAQLGKIKAKIKAAMQKIGADVAGKSGAGDDGTA